MVYLDSGASAQKPAVVIDRMATFAAHHYANIHRGVYGLAQDADSAYEGARHRAAQFVNADPRGTVFTKNVTEAFNLVARSWGEANLQPGDQIVLTELEHHANLVPWQVVAQRTGAELVWMPVLTDGTVDLAPLHEALAGGRVKMVCLRARQQVLGTILPIAEIVRAAHAAGALVTVDGAQAVPHMPVDIAELGADFYGWTGHKLYGPSGIGVLHARRALLEEMPPFLVGGDMISIVTKESTTWAPVPTKFEAGTPPIIEAAASPPRSTSSTALAWRPCASMAWRSRGTHSIACARSTTSGSTVRSVPRTAAAHRVLARLRAPARHLRGAGAPRDLRARRSALRRAAETARWA